jgi:hypothetical protein
MGTVRAASDASMETKSAFRWERANAPREDWRNLIRASSREDDVVELMRDHLARWTPEEIARLPVDCRPPRIRDAEDISRWAFELASTHCAQASRGDDEPMLERMLEFVTQAAIRLSELKAQAPRNLA